MPVSREGRLNVALNENEQLIVEMLAKKRMATKPSTRVYTDSHWEQERNSVGGEWAFCKWANFYPDTATGHAPLQDCVSYTGEMIDVKTSTHKRARLLLKAKSRPAICDKYVLVICDWPEFEVCGWMTGEELAQQTRLTDFGLQTTSYAARQSELQRPGN